MGVRSAGAYSSSLRRYYCYDCLDGNYIFKLILGVGISVIVAVHFKCLGIHTEVNANHLLKALKRL